jgi:hypothetical protein
LALFFRFNHFFRDCLPLTRKQLINICVFGVNLSCFEMTHSMKLVGNIKMDSKIKTADVRFLYISFTLSKNILGKSCFRNYVKELYKNRKFAIFNLAAEYLYSSPVSLSLLSFESVETHTETRYSYINDFRVLRQNVYKKRTNVNNGPQGRQGVLKVKYHN